MAQNSAVEQHRREDALRYTIDFYQTALEMGKRWADLQTRTFGAFASLQANVVGQYLSDSLCQLSDHRYIADPSTYFAKQAEILRTCGRRAMDEAIEVSEQTVDLLAKSRDEMDQMMEDMSKSA